MSAFDFGTSFRLGRVSKNEVCKATACFLFQAFRIPPLYSICGASRFREEDRKSALGKFGPLQVKLAEGWRDDM